MTDHLSSPAHSPDPTIHSSAEFSPVDIRVRRHCMYALTIFFVFKKNASCGKTDEFNNQTRHTYTYTDLYRFCEQGWTLRRALYY